MPNLNQVQVLAEKIDQIEANPQSVQQTANVLREFDIRYKTLAKMRAEMQATMKKPQVDNDVLISWGRAFGVFNEFVKNNRVLLNMENVDVVRSDFWSAKMDQDFSELQAAITRKLKPYEAKFSFDLIQYRKDTGYTEKAREQALRNVEDELAKQQSSLAKYKRLAESTRLFAQMEEIKNIAQQLATAITSINSDISTSTIFEIMREPAPKQGYCLRCNEIIIPAELCERIGYSQEQLLKEARQMHLTVNLDVKALKALQAAAEAKQKSCELERVDPSAIDLVERNVDELTRAADHLKGLGNAQNIAEYKEHMRALNPEVLSGSAVKEAVAKLRLR